MLCLQQERRKKAQTLTLKWLLSQEIQALDSWLGQFSGLYHSSCYSKRSINPTWPVPLRLWSAENSWCDWEVCLCKSKEYASSLVQGKTLPHKAAIPAQTMRILHCPVRKCSGSKATLSVQDKLCTDAPSNSKLCDQKETSFSDTLLSVFFLLWLFCNNT